MTEKDRVLACEDVLRRLVEYLDHELDAHEHQEVEQHLEACRSCFSRAGFERRLKAKLGELGQEPTAAALEHRIRDLLRKF